MSSVNAGIPIIDPQLVLEKQLEVPEWLDWELWQGPYQESQTIRTTIFTITGTWFYNWEQERQATTVFTLLMLYAGQWD